MSRNDIRTAILSAKPKKKVIEMFGQKVEIRQPSVGEILKLREGTDANAEAMFIRVMLGYCYVPGTNEKVFEPTDAEALAAVPFGPEFDEMNQAVADLTQMKVDVQEGNLKGTP